ncbi:MAG: SsrA-binding protein SmpB [Clostridia bacterium]|nr:SsrA-binding protein SmpB [Clostridia bacterium]
MKVRIIANNKQARHNYFVLSSIEAGIVLEGSEVKSMRLGHCSLKDSFVLIKNSQAIIKNMHIGAYEKSTAYSLDEKRDRVLLLNKAEIRKLYSQVQAKGLTIIPLSVYFKGQYVKVEIGLCKGKHTYDKKNVLKEKDIALDTVRQLKNY